MFQVFQMTKGESSDELVLGEPSTHDETRTVKRRNRVLQSCIPCHELRRKCDRQRPCTRCADHGVAGQCVYQLEDPATRTGDQDELTRLRKRVLELEHTVRVLTQRHSPREAFDQKVLQPGSSHPQGSAEDDVKGKKPRDPSSSSSNPAGQPQPGTLIPGQSSSPNSGSGMLGNIPHCGCAISTVGRQILGQLQTNLAESIHRLKALPEHQRHNVNCPLYTQVIHLHHHVGQAMGNVSLQQAVYPGGAQSRSYGLQSPYAPTASSHSSASPPQTLSGDFLNFNQNDTNFELTPAEPYPYNAPHSSTLGHTLSHSLSHPHGSSGTTSHGQHTFSYNLTGVPGLASSTGNYQQYQQPAQPVQQYAAEIPSMPRAGPSSSAQASSLATWNSMGLSSTSAAQPTHRPSSKSTRGPSTRPAK